MEQHGKQELMHYEFPENRSRFDSVIATIAAQVADTTDGVIVQAIIKAAADMGITDLYLIDKKFIQEALSERIARAKNEPLTIEELQQMDGEPVWIEGHGWALVVTKFECLYGWQFGSTFSHASQHYTMYRHKPEGR